MEEVGDYGALEVDKKSMFKGHSFEFYRALVDYLNPKEELEDIEFGWSAMFRDLYKSVVSQLKKN